MPPELPQRGGDFTVPPGEVSPVSEAVVPPPDEAAPSKDEDTALEELASLVSPHCGGRAMPRPQVGHCGGVCLGFASLVVAMR